MTPHFNITKLVSSLFLIFSSISLSAQQLYFENFSVDDGLPQSTVNAIAEDHNGFLWMGTQGGGICRFDGSRFTVFDSRHGLPGDIVNCIKIDQKKRVWIGCSWGGFVVYDGTRFRNYSNGEDVSTVNCFEFDKNGNTWIGANQGLFFYDGNKLVARRDIVPEKNGVSLVRIINENLVAVLSDNGLGIYDGSKTTQVVLPDNKRTDYIELDSAGNLMIASGNILFMLTPSQVKNVVSGEKAEFKTFKDGLFSRIRFITLDQNKHLWVSDSENGLFHFGNGRTEMYNRYNGLETNQATCVYVDKNNIKWIGTSGEGLKKLRPPKFINHSNLEGLNSSNIFAIYKDPKGDVWVGTSQNGVYRYNENTHELVQYNEQNSSLPSPAVRAIVSKDNKIYFGTGNGLSIYDGKKFTNYTNKNGFPGTQIRSLCFGSNGELYIGTFGDGLIIMKDEKFEQINNENGLVHNYVHAIYEDSKQNVWLGTGAGAVKMNKRKLTTYDGDDGLCNMYIGSITEDKNGNIWFGTDKCLMKYDGLRFKSFTREDGLSSTTIYFVKGDKNGNLWVGTNSGLDKIEFRQYGEIGRVKRYGKNDGFIGTECNSRAVFEDHKGNLWFGTIKGLIKYIARNDMPETVNHKVSIQEMKVFFEDIKKVLSENEKMPYSMLVKDAELASNQNHITFHFIATNKTDPWNNHYSYMLKGFDREWSPPATQTSTTYSNLPPGEYEFMVRYVDNYGNKSSYIDSYKFTIARPYWQKWWFYLIILIGLIIAVIYFNIQREHKIEFEKTLLEKKVIQRTIELTQQKEERELLLKEIHHRVKNNLQVINSLINIQSTYIKDEQSLQVFEECRNRIKSMALIHEKFYQSKDFTHIDLREYVENLVQGLIQTYNVNKDIEVITEIRATKLGIDTIIPLGLILNEIISNSLKYAFDQTDKGLITIKLTRSDEKKYTLTISDNGKGFEKEKFMGNSQTLGFELIKILTEQINGRIELLPGNGTSFILHFFDIDKNRTQET